ncbi:hypothetical protein [Yersinia intermedia]|uniref:hypothetical protein n=1 Tax=Yersinia intermedia TaxID=631 RepID=UPI0011A92762|nr:hypothetical protein [Yersinia intermedia]
MSKQDLIANQIIEILKSNNKPAYKIYFKQAGEVVIDFSKDMSFIFIDFIDTENRSRNEIATIRLLDRIKKGVTNEDLTKILNIITNEFVSKVRKDKIKSLADSLGKATGKFVISTAILNDLSTIFSKRLVSKFLVGSLFSTIYSIGGARSRAIYGSDALREKTPDIYNKLRGSGDLDLFYFLVDSYASPFIEAMIIKDKNPAAWDEIIMKIIIGLDRQ